MALLYGLLVTMMVASMCLNVVPFRANKAIYSKGFVSITLMTLLTAMGLYQFSGDKHALNQWLKSGKSHYQLLQAVNQLGGINGMISRVNRKLQADPNDAHGWFILGKLYLSEQNVEAAQAAIRKAHELRPQDEKITYYYQTLSGAKRNSPSKLKLRENSHAEATERRDHRPL